MEYPWYEVVHGERLLQGDFLDQCPVLVPRGRIPVRAERPPDLLEAEVLEYDVVVMSQSCDLEEGKLDLVLVCPHWSLDEIAQANDFFKSRRGKEDLRRGNVPGYHLLAPAPLPGRERPARVVDFRAAYSLPYPFLMRVVGERGERLRLLPPYREHLAQAFARFFMRVGLPVDIPRFT